MESEAGPAHLATPTSHLHIPSPAFCLPVCLFTLEAAAVASVTFIIPSTRHVAQPLLAWLPNLSMETTVGGLIGRESSSAEGTEEEESQPMKLICRREHLTLACLPTAAWTV